MRLPSGVSDLVVGTSRRPSIETLTPGVTARLVDPSGAKVRMRLTVRDHRTHALRFTGTSGPVASGRYAIVRVRRGALRDRTVHDFEVRAESAGGGSLGTASARVATALPDPSFGTSPPPLPPHAALMERAIDEVTLSCDNGLGLVPKDATAEQVYGVRKPDGTRAAPELRVRTDQRCVGAAMNAVLAIAEATSNDDAAFVRALRRQIADARSHTIAPAPPADPPKPWPRCC